MHFLWEQSWPPHPGAQKHTRSGWVALAAVGATSQTPRPEHSPTSPLAQPLSHASPWRPRSQRHAPSTHAPAPLQLLGQSFWEQSAPPYPGSHSHANSRHTPCPEHGTPTADAVGHVGRWHHAPVYPCVHQHVPL